MSEQEFEDAAAYHHWSELKLLIDKNPTMLWTFTSGGFTLAGKAAAFGRLDLLRFMYKKVLSLPGPHDQMLRDTFERAGIWNWSPVVLAAVNSRLDCMQFLIDICPSGPSILETPDGWFRTPAHNVVQNGTNDSLEFILRNAPSGLKVLEVASNAGFTPWRIATRATREYFTPEKIREICIQRELGFVRSAIPIIPNSFVSLVFSILEQHIAINN